MDIHEQIVTTAAPERAWALIADLSGHGRWNPHIVDTQVWNGALAQLGTRYRVTYDLNGRRSEFDAEVVEWVPGSRFAVRLEERLKGDGSHLDRYMVESYTIEPHGQGARVVHDVRVHHDGIPWYWRVLIWFIQKTGHPVGKTIMQAFAELAEGAGEPGRAAS